MGLLEQSKQVMLHWPCGITVRLEKPRVQERNNLLFPGTDEFTLTFQSIREAQRKEDRNFKVELSDGSSLLMSFTPGHEAFHSPVEPGNKNPDSF